MTIEIVSGDLLDAFDRGEVNVIGHVVNCQGRMNSGIAKDIRQRYPEVFNVYETSLNHSVADKRGWLGRIQQVKIQYNAYGDYRDKVVYNMFGQYYYGTDKRYIDYGALSQCFCAMTTGLSGYRNEVLSDVDILGLPYLPGCGLAGGDEKMVMELINFYFHHYDVKIYKLEK